MDLVHRHAPLDAPDHRAGLVVREIHPRALAQQREDARQPILVGQQQGRRPIGLGGTGMLDEGQQPLGHGVGRQDEIGQPGRNGGARHPIEAGRLLVLHQHDPARFLDGPDAAHAVAAGAGQDDGDGFLGLILGQRAQEHVDGQVEPAIVVRFAEQQLAAHDRQNFLGRDEVDRIGLDPHPLLGPPHRHRGAFGEQLDHHALVVGREMLDDDEGHAAVGGHV